MSMPEGYVVSCPECGTTQNGFAHPLMVLTEDGYQFGFDWRCGRCGYDTGFVPMQPLEGKLKEEGAAELEQELEVPDEVPVDVVDEETPSVDEPDEDGEG